MNKVKNKILQNTGLDEAVNFDMNDVDSVRKRADEIANKISALTEEVRAMLDESNELRTDSGNFLLKGHNDFVHAFNALNKAFLEVRKGSFKGVGRMPKGGPGTFYDER